MNSNQQHLLDSLPDYVDGKADQHLKDAIDNAKQVDTELQSEIITIQSVFNALDKDQIRTHQEYISRNISARQYRTSFGYYTEQNLLVSIMFYAAASMLFFGAFVMRYRLELILSFPLIAFIMAMYLNEDGSAQAPEKLWREKPLMLASFICLILMVFLMNYSLPGFTTFFQQSVLH